MEKNQKNYRHHRKHLGGLDVFCIATGAMISSGIFILPGLAFKQIGAGVFLAYAIAGLFALLGVLAVIELCTAMPKAGGAYYFIERSLGACVGTVSGVLSYLALILKASFAAYGLGAIFQALFGFDIVWVASITALFFVVINLIGTKEAAIVEIIMVGGLLLIMFGYVLGVAPQISITRFQPFFNEGDSGKMLFSTAALVFVSFGGLLQVSAVSEEVRVPRRSIPIGMISSIVIVAILYILVLIVTTGSLPAADFAKSLTPLADVAKLYYGNVGYGLITVASMLAFITTVNAGIMAASRFPIAMGRDQLMPSVCAKTFGAKKTPVIAVGLTGALMMCVLQIPLELLVKVASAIIMASYVLVNLAVIILRESKIQNYRPTFKSPLYPYLHIVSIVAFTSLIIQMGSQVILTCLGVICFAVVLFLSSGRKSRREFAMLHLVERITNRQLTDHRLESELREIIQSRDEIVSDSFDRVVEDASVLIVDERCSLKDFFKYVAVEFSSKIAMPVDEFRSLLFDRELESSTVFASHVAIPHIVVEGNGVFSLFIVKCNKGVEFNLGEERVHVVFVLVGSRDQRNLHLRALAALAQIVSEKGFYENWMSLSTEAQLRDAILLGTRKRH